MNQNNPEPVLKAAKELAACRTAERDKYVVHIMEKIDKGVRDISSNRGNDRVINHIRFIREAGVPEERLSSVKKRVADLIKNEYGPVGFKSLSRVPKKKEIEPYFLLK